MEKISIEFMPQIAQPLTEKEAVALPPMSLAFIGDSVHSLFIRTLKTVGTDKETGELHKEVTAEVKATHQASVAKLMLPLLDKTESELYKRARNARIHTTAKHAAIGEYRSASGFEAVVGFLYLTGNTERLLFLLSQNDEEN